MDSLQTRFGFRFFKFGRTELNENDLRVLESTESSLRSTDYNVLLSATEFLQFVVLRDFPAEVFLERPNVVRSLIAIINNSSSSSSNAVWSNLAAASTHELLRTALRDAAISTLSEIAGALLTRLRFVHSVDCYRQIRFNGVLKADVSATSDQLSRNPWLLLRSARADLLSTNDSNSQRDSTLNTDSVANVFSRHVNAHSSRLTGPGSQNVALGRSISLAAFAFDVMNCVLSHLHISMQRVETQGATVSNSSSASSAVKSTRCMLTAEASSLIWSCLRLVAHAIDWRVLDFATTMSFEAREISEKLETFFSNLGRCLVNTRRWTLECVDEENESEIAGSSASKESLRDGASRYAAFTTLAHVAALAVAYLVPPDKVRMTLPDEFRHALVFTYLDGPLGASHPHIRSLLHAHVAALSKPAEGLAADLERVQRSIDATCRFLTVFDALFGTTNDFEGVINLRVQLANKEADEDCVQVELDTLVELVCLTRDALLCQPVVCCKQFIDAVVRLSSLLHRLGSDTQLRSVRFDLSGVLLRLLANGASEQVQALTYEALWRLVQEALSAERAAKGENAMQAGAFSVAFLLERDHLYEAVCFGMHSSVSRVRSAAKQIVERLLSSQFLLGSSLWSALMENVALSFAMLQTSADADCEFGRTLLRLCAPLARTNSEVVVESRLQTRLTNTECTRSTLRFLLSSESKLRAEGVNRLVDVLARESDAVEKRPSFTQVDFRSLGSLLIVEHGRGVDPFGLKSVASSSGVNQSESMLKVLDIFASSTIEISVRRSAAEQLAIFLLDVNLHAPFVTRGGLQLTLSTLQRGVLKSQLAMEPLLVPSVAILRRLLQADSTLRHSHAHDAPLMLNLVRVLLLNQQDAVCKAEVAFCLTLLLFDELSVQNSASGGFALPENVVRKYTLPLHTTQLTQNNVSYWASSDWNDLTTLKPLFDERAQQKAAISSLKLVSSSAHSVLSSFSPSQSLSETLSNQQSYTRLLYSIAVQRIRIDWHLAYADTTEQLLVTVHNELHAEKPAQYDSELQRRVQLNKSDKLALVNCNVFFALREQLFAVSNAVRHEHVLDALEQLEQLTSLVKVLPAQAQAVLRSCLTNESTSQLLGWRAAFERFFRVAPANVADELLLCRLLRFCGRALHSSLRHASGLMQLCEAVATRCGSPVWVLLVQDASSASQFPQNAALNLLALRVHKRLHSECLDWFAALVRVASKSEALAACVAKLVLTLVQTRLSVDESAQFYNLAALQSALTCLMHVTATRGWASASEMTVDSCIALVRTYLKIVAAFQHGCGPDLLSSRMGRHIRIAALVALEHTVIEVLERTPLPAEGRARFVTELFAAMSTVATDNGNGSASESQIGSGDSVVDWLCTMWLHADIELRAVSLSFTACITRLVPEVCALLITCGVHASVRGGMLNVLLAFVLDDTETGLVRRCAASCLANLLQFLNTNGRVQAPGAKDSSVAMDNGLLLASFARELTPASASSSSSFVDACLRAFKAYFPYPFAVVSDAPLVQLASVVDGSSASKTLSRSVLSNTVNESSADWHVLHTTGNASVTTESSSPEIAFFVNSSLEMPLVSTAPILEQLTNHCAMDITRLGELQLSSADLLSDLCVLLHTMLDARFVVSSDCEESDTTTSATSATSASASASSVSAQDESVVRELLADSHLLVIPLKTLLDTGFLTEYTVRVAQLLACRDDQYFYATDSLSPAVLGLDALLLLYANAFRTLRALIDRAARVLESSEMEARSAKKGKTKASVAPQTLKVANAVLSAVLNDSKFLENVASTFEYKRLLDAVRVPLPLANLTRFWLETMLFVQSVLFTVRVGVSSKRRETPTPSATQAIVLSLIDPRQFLAGVLIDTLALRVADIVEVCSSVIKAKHDLPSVPLPARVLTYDFLSTLCYTFALHRPLTVTDVPRTVLHSNENAYAALCRLLVSQFDSLTIAVRKPTDSPSLTLEYLAFTTCIRLVLAVVGETAKRDALKAGLLESAVCAIEYDLGRLNANQLRLLAPVKNSKSGKPSETERIRINYGILQNLLLRCPEAKTAAVFSGLPNTLRRSWTWALLDSTLMCSALDLMHVLTANAVHSNAICRQLAIVSNASSNVTSPTKSAGNSPQKGLRKERDRLASNASSVNMATELPSSGSTMNLATVQSVFSTIVPPSYANLLACVLKQAETPWNRSSAPIVIRAFAVLTNLCGAVECRSLLFKSNFLQRFARLDFGAAYKSGVLTADAAGVHATIGSLLSVEYATDSTYSSPVTAHSLMLWLNMLLNVSCSPDGQQMIMKIDGVIDILVELSTCGGVECLAQADGSTMAIHKQDIPLRALLILKNLCKSTGCKQKLIGMPHFLNNCLLRCVQAGVKNLETNGAMARVALVALRQLVHSNQKARALLKTESTLQLLLDAFNCAAKLRAENEEAAQDMDTENHPKLLSKADDRTVLSKSTKRPPAAAVERLAQTLISILNE